MLTKDLFFDKIFLKGVFFLAEQTNQAIILHSCNYSMIFNSSFSSIFSNNMGSSQIALYRDKHFLSIVTWQWIIYGKYYPFNSYDNLKEGLKQLVNVTIQEEYAESMTTLKDILEFDVYQIQAKQLNILNGLPERWGI